MSLLRREKEAILLTTESLSESADCDPRSRWIIGVGFAAVPAIVGAIILWQMALRYVQWENINPSAARELQHYFAWGAGALGVAAFMHFHFFWTPHPKYHVVGWLGKNLAAGLLVYILLTVMFRAFVG